MERKTKNIGGVDTIDTIVERQKAIENGQFNSLGIFAEGTTSNGKYIMPFKKGAFYSLLPVQPIVLQYRGFPGTPDMGCQNQFDFSLFFPFANLFLQQFLYELPPFIPNDYLFETHKDKGTEKWEIYAWAVRDAMSKASGIPKCDDANASIQGKDDYMVKVRTKKAKKTSPAT